MAIPFLRPWHWRWEWGGQHHAPAALSPGKTQYLLYRSLGGPQGRSGRVRKITPTGIRSPDRPARSESLYRLSYPGQRKLKGMRSIINIVKISQPVQKLKWAHTEGVWWSHKAVFFNGIPYIPETWNKKRLHNFYVKRDRSPASYSYR